MARCAPELPTEAPHGFAARVVARLREREARDWTLWLLPRVAGIAAAISLVALGFWMTAPPVADLQDLAAAYVKNKLESGL